MKGGNNYIENTTVPNFLKNNKIKLGMDEDDTKPAPIMNNNKQMNSNEQNTKEKIQFLFPNLTPEDVTNVLQRSEYNIEKAIILIKELKDQQNKLNTLANPMAQEKQEMEEKRRKNRGIIKRNYISTFPTNTNNKQITSIYPQNHNNINNINANNQIHLQNASNNINNNSNYNININRNQNLMIHGQHGNQINIDINNNNQRNGDRSINNNINNNNGTLEQDRTDLINKQINFLLIQFGKMTNISELKRLLKDIGFPEQKEEGNENENKQLEEILKEKLKNNAEERLSIVTKYKKHESLINSIRQKEEKIDELTSSLGNLIESESEMKMREENYRNELIEYYKNCRNNNNIFNNPEEGY
jgi:hypothetical protein